MDIRKLLIADPSDIFTGSLSDMLGSLYDIRVCHDGIQTLNQLEAHDPDILVIDLMLSGLDGISLLKDLCARPRRPAILITTRFHSDYIEAAVDMMGVDYVMAKPCDMRALAERIHDLAREGRGNTLSPPCSELTVSNMLMGLDLSTKCVGYRYLESAILHYEQEPGLSVTKELYPQIARESGCSSTCVERAIRSVIHSAWLRRDEAAWRRYFRATRNGIVPRPTNTQFIATLAEYLRRQKWSAAG